MPKISWKENHNVHTANLGIVTMIVNWTSDGYEISVQGVHQITMRQRYPDLDEAKARAIILTKKKLCEALVAVEEGD
jgi:hypothetical protein